MFSSHVPLNERVASTLKRHAEERCHLDERHAMELEGVTDSGTSADDLEAVLPAVPSLVQLLKLSGGASVAASSLLRLSRTSDAAREAIRQAGAIPPLVALLHAGAGSEAASIAAGVLCVLAVVNHDRSNRDAIQAWRDAILEAGAIPPLVVLLHAGAQSRAAASAAGVLRWLSLIHI